MKLGNIARTVLSLGSLALAAAADNSTSSNSSTPAITVKGNAFYDSATNERFYIRGVDYQPGGSSNLTDPLADADICSRDVPVFKDLGINTIRVYTVDNSLDHSECMQMLSDAGIYLILDVNTPTAAISRHNAACSYNADYLQNVFATIDTFAQYDNVLGFFAGNEVINSDNTTATATYVKAVVRDMKKYIKARDYRTIPVGYSAADIVANRQLTAQYFNCGDDADARIDMFGVNDYSWCGPSSFAVSGYATKMQLYKNYSIPIFLSEFGCNKVVSSRPFTEIQAIYSTQMSSVFSGGLVYEYSNETNNYGLVKIDDTTSVTKLTDYSNLKSEYASVENPAGDGGAYAGNDYSTCPDYVSGTWEANNTLPEMPSAASAYFKSGAGMPMGTYISTQNSCHDDDDDDIASLSSASESSSSSSSSSASSSSVSSVNSTSTQASSTVSSSSSSSSASSSTKSSKSKGAAAGLEVPALFQAVAQIAGYII